MQKLLVENTQLEGVKLITPPTLFEDFRGEYVELFNREIYNDAGINHDFKQDDISVSSQNVLRGLHGDAHTWKLISCLLGKFYLIVVNNNPKHHQFRAWASFTLSEKNRKQVLIPPNFGNGHLVLSDQAIFHYKQTSNYDRASQFTILWNDPAFDFWWPIQQPILSQRDEGRA